MRSTRERGFALLIVLWTLVLITLLITQVNSAGRSETQLASNLRLAARLEALADGAVHAEVFRLLQQGPRGVIATGGVSRVTLDGAKAEIRVSSEADKVNPSLASPELLQALMRAVGVDTATAANLATAIVVWRTPSGQTGTGGARFDAYRAAGLPFGPSGAPFLSIDEVGAVVGMTPALLQRLAPHLTLYSTGDANPTTPDPIVRAALLTIGRASAQAGTNGTETTQVVTIQASIEGSGGGRFTRLATVQLSFGGSTPDYRIVAWNSAN